MTRMSGSAPTQRILSLRTEGIRFLYTQDSSLTLEATGCHSATACHHSALALTARFGQLLFCACLMSVIHVDKTFPKGVDTWPSLVCAHCVLAVGLLIAVQKCRIHYHLMSRPHHRCHQYLSASPELTEDCPSTHHIAGGFQAQENPPLDSIPRLQSCRYAKEGEKASNLQALVGLCSSYVEVYQVNIHFNSVPCRKTSRILILRLPSFLFPAPSTMPKSHSVQNTHLAINKHRRYISLQHERITFPSSQMMCVHGILIILIQSLKKRQFNYTRRSLQASCEPAPR
ncbi:hypothetical protein P691DRAFT_105279 [Macrolepiota fuliginosa MF-IS2]|uniref:Uncharacterized protein n=1 Tax=Macrolepiota fuliginosa MF-IS2 TaxID=1400762 RepID=A0A9P6C3D3_9AGAR|nr:hypothetical protein P691DRAFT_105279 [Macrolepiota fuliginosa MF-IS2]